MASMKKIIICIISLYLITTQCLANIGSNFPKSDKLQKSECYGSVFGSNGLQLFGGKDKNSSDTTTKNKINAFLWHAALDVIQFMPLSSTDHSGGVINTDWYDDPELKNTMYKVTIVIKSSQLNTNALNVTVFKRKFEEGRWKDQKTNRDLATQLEDQILEKARELKVTQEAIQ